MKDIMSALYAFWSQFGIPAYSEDTVPANAELPYIRYQVAKAPLMGATVLTAYNYHRQKLMGNLERAEVAGRIADAIPESGVKLPLDGGGFVVLYRNTDFQNPYQDPEDLDVIGVRTSVEVHFYAI